MITTTIGRRVAVAALAATAAALSISGGTAAALTTPSTAVRPDPGEGVGLTWTARLTPGDGRADDDQPTCPLRRLDTQFVRCDLLTGAGVPAPAFIPEWTP